MNIPTPIVLGASKKDKKLAILKLLDEKCKHHYREYLISKANEEAAIAGSKQWERENPDDGVGGFSMNRFNPDGATYDRQIKEKIYKFWQEICDYALESLIE